MEVNRSMMKMKARTTTKISSQMRTTMAAAWVGLGGKIPIRGLKKSRSVSDNKVTRYTCYQYSTFYKIFSTSIEKVEQIISGPERYKSAFNLALNTYQIVLIVADQLLTYRGD